MRKIMLIFSVFIVFLVSGFLLFIFLDRSAGNTIEPKTEVSKGSDQKTDNIAFLMEKKGVYLDCSGAIDTRQKTICNKMLAEKVTSPVKCLAYTDQVDKDWCFYYLSKITDNTAFCDEINCKYVQADCLENK